MYVVICMYKKQLIIKEKKAENLTVLMGGPKSPPPVSLAIAVSLFLLQ